ncbi:6683_t:CDS:10 [Entrophospora sp. SA101]|nr:2335_t:CDS:10 [Entrophospora sp. SA101]CAJ0746189.1 17880_t:CDS:10 [Entrophospora sp. SA101]CAJ0749445.1 6683_t:CDS:10 [Entrophospora sp. SA101]CAJ0913722.1 20908_t:CDS:10 [Entrophospora sp. SA101]
MSEFPRISLPVPLMKPHYDVVVIGSGYGGSIAASRMSRAGKRVALLERGKERWPGEFPQKLHECVKEFQGSIQTKSLGQKTGLYHLYDGEQQDVLCGCGLGGTSLINANVALEADERVWKQTVWPREIHEDMENYGRAKEVIHPSPYPEHFPEVPKLKALEEQAKRLGEEFHKNFKRIPVAISWEDRVNYAGVRQNGSTLVGNDVSGNNDGSKNTMLMTYIPDAWNHGCEIFCEVNVPRIKKDSKSNKWIVFYEWLDTERCTFSDESTVHLYFVTADSVFIGAGTMGSNEILLRSKLYGLPTSPNVGKGFSGNGDILGFAFNSDIPVHAVGVKERSHQKKAVVGPDISGVIDMRLTGGEFDGYVIEDGTLPHAIRALGKLVIHTTDNFCGVDPPNIGISKSIARKWRKFVTNLAGVYQGAMLNTQIYLVMSHDDHSGQMELVDDKLKIQYPGVGESKNAIKINEVLKNAAFSIGASWVPSPTWNKLNHRGLVSVHPLGGCNMASDGSKGVVNHKGQVFTGSGVEVYEDLYICDGSIVPTSLAINPFLTISCLSERICELAAKDNGLKIDYKPAEQLIDFTKPLKSFRDETHELVKLSRKGPLEKGISFTEVMKGYFSTEIISKDFAVAEKQAKSADSTMQFLLTIICQDTDKLIDLDDNCAFITGTVSCRALSPDPLLVTRGKFRLFVPEPDSVDSNRMIYNLNLLATDGSKYRFKGFKLVNNSNVLHAWYQTTALFVSVYLRNKKDDDLELDEINANQGGIGEVDDDENENLQIASGTKRSSAFLSFHRFFVMTLMKHSFAILRSLEYPTTLSAKLLTHSKFIRPKKKTYTITSEDGIKSALHRYEGGRKAAMTYEMWSTDFSKNNLLDYLLENGYDVFLNDYRLAPTNAAVHDQHTVDKVMLDQVAAVNEVRNITGVEKIAVIAHCVGSLITFMGVLSGQIKGVGTIICSSTSMHPYLGFWNRVKMNLRLIDVYRYVLRRPAFDVRTSADTNFIDRIINQLLRFYPVPKGQVCRNALCLRASLCYGTLYQHEHLTQQVHDYQHQFFGSVNLTTLKHLFTMARKCKLVDYNSKDIYVNDENVKNNLNFPITFIHGDKNVVFEISSTRKSYDYIRQINDPDNYSLREIDGYGHLDVWWGTNAIKDVYPIVLEHLEKNKDKYGYH